MDSEPYTFYIIATTGVAVATTILAVHGWRVRSAQGALAFMWAMIGATGWSLRTVLMLTSPTTVLADFWSRLGYLFIVSTPLAWLAFALQYTDRPKWLTWRNAAWAALVPCLTLLFIWTNNVHHLFWREVNFYQAGAFTLWTMKPGAWFLVHTAYSYLLTLIGMALIIRMALLSFHPYRWQAIILLIGAFAPLIASVPSSLAGTMLSFTPFGLTITGLMLMLALSRYRLLDLRPVGRDALIDSLTDSMLVIDTHNRIVDLNPAAQTLIGLPGDEILGQPTEQALASWPELVRRLQNVLSTQTDITLERNGVPRYYNLRISPLTDRNGRPTGRLVHLRDITERKMSEQALQRANLELQARNGELDAFGLTVAHDLKDPLSNIIGYTNLLIEDGAELPPAETIRLVRTIAQISHKMNGIIEELMLLSGLHKQTVQMEPLDMAHIVGQALNRLERMIKEYNAIIIQPPPTAWPVGTGYAPWVEEVWVNYLSNAIKYGGAPPRVELGARVESDHARFWVRDNGPGIPRQEQARLFAPFERLTPHRASGYGVGLSITRRIVEKMGGQVGVESDPTTGEGSTFSFTLPLDQSSEA